MDIITAETLLWRDFDEAVSDRHYPTLTTRCREAEELAAQLNRVLAQLSDMPGALLQWLVERGEGTTLRGITHDPAQGDTFIRLDYGDNAGGLLICSPFFIHGEALWHGHTLAERYSPFDDEDAIIRSGYDLQHLFNTHLDWLRDEAARTRQYIADRKRDAARV